MSFSISPEQIVISIQERGLTALHPRHNELMEMSSSEIGLAKLGKKTGGFQVGIAMKLAMKDNTLPLTCDLVKAAQSIRDQHYMLQCKVVEATYNQITSTFFQVDKDIDIPVIEWERIDSSSWVRAWQMHSKTPLKLNTPLAKIIYVHNDKFDQVEILLLCHHCICDGKSLSSVASKYLMELSGEEYQHEFQPLVPAMEISVGNTFSSMPRSTMTKLISLLSLGWKAMLNKRGKEFPVNHSYAKYKEGESGDYGVAINESYHVVLGQEISTKLICLCREKKTTLTGLLGSAVMHASAMVISEKEVTNQLVPVQLSCSVDLRPLYASPIRSNNLSCNIAAVNNFVFEIGIENPNSIWDIAKEFRSHIVQGIESKQPLAIGSVIGNVYTAQCTNTMLPCGRPTLTLSNWGLSPISEEYGNYTVREAVPLINTTPYAMPFVVVNTVHGAIQLSFLGSHPALSTFHLASLQHHTVSLLSDLVE